MGGVEAVLRELLGVTVLALANEAARGTGGLAERDALEGSLRAVDEPLLRLAELVERACITLFGMWLVNTLVYAATRSSSAGVSASRACCTAACM